MSVVGAFPFDPEKLARLATLSRTLGAHTPLAPIAAPIVVDEQGYAWIPAPGGGDEEIGSYVHAGLRMGWAPMPEQGGILLTQWGGLGPEPDFEEEGVTAFMTREGLRRFIADLQTIDNALGAA